MKWHKLISRALDYLRPGPLLCPGEDDPLFGMSGLGQSRSELKPRKDVACGPTPASTTPGRDGFIDRNAPNFGQC